MLKIKKELNWIKNNLDLNVILTNEKSEYVILYFFDERIFIIPKIFLLNKKFPIYNPQTKKGKILKKIIPLLLKVNINLPWIVLKNVKIFFNNNWKLFLKNNLNINNDNYISLYLGTPGYNRKPSIIINDKFGNNLYFLKIGWNEKSIKSILKESYYLKIVKNEKKFRFKAPDIIGLFNYNKNLILVQKAFNLDVRSKKLDENDILVILNSLINYNIKLIKLSKSDYWNDIKNKLNTINLSNQNLKKINAFVKKIEKEYSNILLPFHLSHGDFAPWNILKNENELILYDWEFAELYRPLAYDLFYYIFQKNLLVEKLKKEKLLKICKLEINYYKKMILNEKYLKNTKDFDFIYKIFMVDYVVNKIVYNQYYVGENYIEVLLKELT